MSFSAPITSHTPGWQNSEIQAQLVDKVMKAINGITVEDIMAKYPEKNRFFCADVKDEIDLFVGFRDFKLDPITSIEQYQPVCTTEVANGPAHYASWYLKDLLKALKD